MRGRFRPRASRNSVVLHEMRPQRSTAAHRTRDACGACLLQLLPLRRRRDQRRRRPSSRDARAGFAGHARRRRASGAGGRRAWRWTATASRRPSQAAILAEPLISVERGEVTGLPPEEWGPTIIATGPLTSPALADAILALDRRAIARLLRRHRADRPLRQHRFRHRLAAIALRQGRARRRRRGLCQLPARPRGNTRPSSTRLLAAEKTEFREFEGTPYFDGCLPIEVMAERGRETLAPRTR